MPPPRDAAFDASDAFQASWQRTERYAAEGPGVSALVTWSARANTLLLLALLIALPLAGVAPNAAAVSALSIACCAATTLTIAACYAVSASLGLLPGFTDDDYRLSAAMDRPPATEVATLGLMLALDLVPLIEWLRPAASARLARAILGAAAAQGLVAVASTPMSAMRGRHALSTAGFFVALVVYEATVAATVPSTLRSSAGADCAYALVAALFAGVGYVAYGLSQWIGHGRLFHLSAAEIFVIAVVIALTLTLGLDVPEQANNHGKRP